MSTSGVLLISVLALGGSPPNSTSDSIPSTKQEFPVFLTQSLRHGLDTSVSPCVDFDQFVNGGWRAATTLPDTLKILTSFEATYHATQLRIGALLDSARQIAAQARDADVRVIGQYYESCLRADSIPKALDRLSMYKALPHDSSRAARCRRLAMSHLPDAVGQVFVRTIVTPQVDAEMRTMVEAIQAEVRNRIRGLAFVPEDAKARTLSAVQYMTFKIAKPADTVDYRDLILSTTDFAATRRAIQEYTAKYKLVRQDGQRGATWRDNQYNPNAHFNGQDNSIEIPTFLFQWPFFDSYHTDATLSYAAAGVVLGHEILHGVTYKLGSEGEASVHQHAQRLVQHYNAIRLADGVAVNGARTLNENLADLGGVLMAYDAWKKTARSSVPSVIEGFTPEQRFFLHYARIWRSKFEPKTLQNLAANGVHSPGPARINGIVMNVPAFAQAFGCKEGEPMAKPASERAVIW